MQCPNCNLNVSDSAKICIHCGMMFSNGTATGVINTVPPQNPAPRQIPNPELPETQAVIDRKRYLQAFTNGKYDSINNSHFSVGTFFLGPVWLLSHKLYKDALKMFGILALIFIIEIALTIFLTLIGALLLVVIIRLVADCIEIKLYYDYCRDFPYLYINNANNKIDKIIAMTNDDEERLKRCRQEGKPLYIIIVLYVLLVILSFGASLFLDSEPEKETKNQTHHQSSVINANSYGISAIGDIVDDKVEPENGESFQKGRYYYFTIDENFSDTFEDVENVHGYVIVRYYGYSTAAHFVCIQENDSDRISTANYGEDNEFSEIHWKNKQNCNIKEDVPSSYELTKVVYKNKKN